ncbi:MAG: hypothetical protein U9R43_15285 [Thermodesulfobacteriota bacterium]|nr:hypothetical protein [Thermodesulfobacteriota bacterium]
MPDSLGFFYGYFRKYLVFFMEGCFCNLLAERIDTKEVQDPKKPAQGYHIRIATEERYRQIKCFIDLTNFTSRAFSMVVNQVVFIMLAYNLLQLYLLRKGRKELNKKTLPRIRQQLLPSDSHVIS